MGVYVLSNLITLVCVLVLPFTSFQQILSSFLAPSVLSSVNRVFYLRRLTQNYSETYCTYWRYYCTGAKRAGSGTRLAIIESHISHVLTVCPGKMYCALVFLSIK